MLVENLHIDGYGVAVQAPQSGHLVVRNNYIHHQIRNGISVNGVLDRDSGEGWGAKLEFCGNEISHSGNGNAKHGFYMHRSNRDGASIDIILVDNTLHSCAWSSCFKSVANSNLIVGNSFYKTRETDPSYSTMYSQMLVDVAACGETTIRNNKFYRWRPDPKVNRSPGGAPIGIRNRKDLNGCDYPRPRPIERTKTRGFGNRSWTPRSGPKNIGSGLTAREPCPFTSRTITLNCRAGSGGPERPAR